MQDCYGSHKSWWILASSTTICSKPTTKNIALHLDNHILSALSTGKWQNIYICPQINAQMLLIPWNVCLVTDHTWDYHSMSQVFLIKDQEKKVREILLKQKDNRYNSTPTITRLFIFHNTVLVCHLIKIY